MPTGIELNDIHQQPGAMTGAHFPIGTTASTGIGGGGAYGTSPAETVAPPPPAIAEHFSIVDDSDASDEESDGEIDNYPDPHPVDPDMTGWSTNQIGCCFYDRWKHSKKKWRNLQGARKPPGRRLSSPSSHWPRGTKNHFRRQRPPAAWQSNWPRWQTTKTPTLRFSRPPTGETPLAASILSQRCIQLRISTSSYKHGYQFGSGSSAVPSWSYKQ